MVRLGRLPPLASGVLFLVGLSVLLLLRAPSASLLPTVAAVCTNATILTATDVVHIAVLVFLIDQPQGVFKGNLSDTPATSVVGYGTDIIQPYNLGLDLYIRKMRARGGMLDLPNGGRTRLNFVYINLAGPKGSAFAADYSIILAKYNLPQFIAVSTVPLQSLNPATPLVQAMYNKIVSKDPAVLQHNWGITQPFTYIVPSAVFPDLATSALANLIEDQQSAVIVHPYLTNRESFVCDGLAPTVSATPDCLAPTFHRNRRQGARRYKTVFSTLPDTTRNFDAALSVMRTLGVKSVAIIYDDLNSFSYWLVQNAQAAAAQLNIPVKATYRLVSNTCDPTQTVGNTTAPNCPPADEVAVGQTQTWPDGKFSVDIARELHAMQPDAVLIAGTPRSAGSYQIGSLFAAMQQVDFTPKALAWAGGIDGWMAQWVSDVKQLGFTWSSRPFDSRLKGSQYQNHASETQFELLPANATHDGPAVFTDAFEAAYGPASPGGPHPMYISTWQSGGLPAIAWNSLVAVQKLVEASMTLDVPTILVAATTINTPSILHALAFDSYGRTLYEDSPLVQKGRDPLIDQAIVISPYNIADQPAEYPVPTWDERRFAPKFYRETNERVMVAINSLCILLCILLSALVIFYWNSPVIRAATPSFCLVIIFGSILMLVSNYFATLVVNDAHCALSVWFLTIGFTCVFCALFVKTFRIWRIFGRKTLSVVKMKDTDLLLAVGAFVLVDIVINAVWMGAVGMEASEVTVDALRPKYNYLTCDFGRASGAIATHLALKGGLLLFGIFLTWAVRHTPSQFNESTSIAAAIYNVSFILCFIIPIIAVDLGGRRTTYLVRAFAIMFASMSTLGLLYGPKFLSMSSQPRNAVTAVKTQEGATTSPSPPKVEKVFSSTNGGGGGQYTDPDLKSHAETGQNNNRRRTLLTTNPMSWISTDGEQGSGPVGPASPSSRAAASVGSAGLVLKMRSPASSVNSSRRTTGVGFLPPRAPSVPMREPSPSPSPSTSPPPQVEMIAPVQASIEEVVHSDAVVSIKYQVPGQSATLSQA